MATKERQTFRRELPCKLSKENILKYSLDLAKLNQNKLATEDQKKQVASDYKAKLDKLDAAIGIFSRTITSGIEHRQVDCFWDFDWTRGEKSLVRTDTSEVVQIDPISDYERQEKLRLDREEKKGKGEGTDGNSSDSK